MKYKDYPWRRVTYNSRKYKDYWRSRERTCDALTRQNMALAQENERLRSAIAVLCMRYGETAACYLETLESEWTTSNLSDQEGSNKD